MRTLVGWSLGGVLVIMFFGVATLAQAQEVIYENDFSSDPNWVTDQPENFYWDAEEEALYIRAETENASSTANRYFYTPTDLDSTQSFTLTWDSKVIDQGRKAQFPFGLLADDLASSNATNINYRMVYSKGAANFFYGAVSGNPYWLGTNFIIKDRSDNGGFGGIGTSNIYEIGTWYRNTFFHDPTTGSVTGRSYNLETGEELISYTRSSAGNGYPITFDSAMKNLGVSNFPFGVIPQTDALPDDALIAYIDNVRLIQGQEPQEPEGPSDLVLQYEPILYLHEDENYQPMNVEAFVEASALWDENGLSADELLIGAGEVTLDDISVGDESADWYLAFSDPINAKSFNPTVASTTYRNLVNSGKVIPTYYSYEMTDSYFDEEGVEHVFTVLQYWYFYAFNDWQEHGGFNNHEGDWESVFVFLDKDTKDPEYVAFSSHLNDGDPELFNPLQYDSVRRDWAEVEKDAGQVRSYVALGSHANYPNNSSGIREVIPFLSSDLTSVDGEHLTSDFWSNKTVISPTSPNWNSKYMGKWGADNLSIGFDGPQGPKFNEVSGIIRFNNPIEWAGIDKIAKETTTEPVDLLSFNNETTMMSFETPLAIGTTVTVDQHDEYISFGSGLDEITFLPHFYDLESSLGSDLPTTTVMLTYNPEEVEMLDIDENNLAAYLYNEALDAWEKLESLLNTTTNTISFVTPHFSRYAIGAEEPPAPDDLFNNFREVLEAGDVKESLKEKLKRNISKIENLFAEERFEKALKELQKLEKTIEKETEKGRIDQNVSDELLSILADIVDLVPSEDVSEEEGSVCEEGSHKDKGRDKKKYQANRCEEGDSSHGDGDDEEEDGEAHEVKKDGSKRPEWAKSFSDKKPQRFPRVKGGR